jgi:hypothetical protein
MLCIKCYIIILYYYIKSYYVVRSVTASTIGRWIKTLLGQAGVNMTQFSAHSIISA